jgi:hypothetical protein
MDHDGGRGHQMNHVLRLALYATPLIVAFPHLAHARRGLPIFIPTSGPLFYILIGVGVLALIFKGFSMLAADSAQAAQHFANQAPKASAQFSSQGVQASVDMERIDRLIASRAQELQSGQRSATSFGTSGGTFGKRARS